MQGPARAGGADLSGDGLVVCMRVDPVGVLRATSCLIGLHAWGVGEERECPRRLSKQHAQFERRAIYLALSGARGVFCFFDGLLTLTAFVVGSRYRTRCWLKSFNRRPPQPFSRTTRGPLSRRGLGLIRNSSYYA